MSGGSYNYVSHTFTDTAETLEGRHANKPQVLALAQLLRRIAEVMHDIEWADSGDTSWKDGNGAIDTKIRAIISPSDEISIAVEKANAARIMLENALNSSVITP